MSLKFYFDTHIARQVAIQLQNNGVDVVRCEDVGLAKASDTEHLEYAIKEGRVMVSVDADFLRLHAEYLTEGKHHTGIVRVNPESQANTGTIVKALLALYQEIESGESTAEDKVHDNLKYIG